MECWGNMTTLREVIKGRDSPVMKLGTKEKRSMRKSKVEKQVSSNWSPHIKEQSESMDIVLQGQGKRYEKGRKL